ncbi:hypothetical protein RHSIM_Rhsim12G0184000 [Rhododendron simsii]|uniref:Uncharacterized protein n=1 Tax=Rhododendron simsii TaxID=118357 RepID=A0A834G325_RHOSS|nr:hypothetical protein RHSIM_Rhsim12G0184000 [Rhododendron simsii]
MDVIPRSERSVALAKREVPHLDTVEKQMFLKEVRLSKAKRKEAETETERLRPASEYGRERHLLKSMLSKHSVSKSEAFSDGRGLHSNATMASQSGRSRSHSQLILLYSTRNLSNKRNLKVYLHFMISIRMKEAGNEVSSHLQYSHKTSF